MTQAREMSKNFKTKPFSSKGVFKVIGVLSVKSKFGKKLVQTSDFTVKALMNSNFL